MKVLAIFLGVFAPALSLILFVVICTALGLWAMFSVAEGNYGPVFLVGLPIVGLLYAQMAIENKTNNWVNKIINETKENTNEKVA